MSTQYIDGSFSPTEDMTEAMETFMNAIESNTAKAFHVGTPREIERVKNEDSNSDKIKAITDRLSDLEYVMNANKIIDIPNEEEIKDILMSTK